MLSLSEWIIILLLMALVYHLATTPKPRRRAMRVIEDTRPQLPAPAETPRDDRLEWIALAGLAIAAIACVGILVLAKAGWV
jgi:hypothetical protein